MGWWAAGGHPGPPEESGSCPHTGAVGDLGRTGKGGRAERRGLSMDTACPLFTAFNNKAVAIATGLINASHLHNYNRTHSNLADIFILKPGPQGCALMARGTQTNTAVHTYCRACRETQVPTGRRTETNPARSHPSAVPSAA